MFNYKDFGLEKGNLYEILATTFSIANKKEIIEPNTACMGIKVNEKNKIQITPFHTTTTYRNLKDNGYLVINFVNDIYLYALAALKSPEYSDEFRLNQYIYLSLKKRGRNKFRTFPILKSSWGFLIGETTKEIENIKKDNYGESLSSTFEIKIFYSEKNKESFKLFNRAENLALEAIVLATKLKVAKNSNNNELYEKLIKQIQSYMEIIRRIGKNQHALKAIELVGKYIDKN